MIEHYRQILADSESRVRRSLDIQVKRKGIWQGGFCDEDGLVHGKFAIYRVTTAIAVYCNPDSVYYEDKGVETMIYEGLAYIQRCQHDNGLFDLISCNFNSAPDTAFCIKRLLPILWYLSEKRKGEEEENWYQTISAIVKRGAEGILEGGFHTPNHRWAIASNLAECGLFFHDERMTGGAERYLKEGIDCNDDGEYTEKSAGNYNRINNEAMMTLGICTGDEKYYDYAVKNLSMMLTYLEPNGSIFTANSTRQDKGKTIYPRDYYMGYLSLGYQRNLPLFLDAANYIFQLTRKIQSKAPDCLIHLMNHPELKNLEHEGSLVPGRFSRLYKDSGIFRGGRDGYTITLMTEQSGFLHLSGESLRLQMKVCGSFFRHRAFCPETVEEHDGTFELKQNMQGWYYLPFEENQGTSDWWKMDPDKRKRIPGPALGVRVQVEECKGGVDVSIHVFGVEGAPFRIEFEVSGAKWLWNQYMVLEAENGKDMVLRDGNAIFSNETESIEIGPGFGNHLYTNGRFGSEPHSEQAFTLYLTDYTEFDHKIKIRIKKQGMMMLERTDEKTD